MKKTNFILPNYPIAQLQFPQKLLIFLFALFFFSSSGFSQEGHVCNTDHNELPLATNFSPDFIPKSFADDEMINVRLWFHIIRRTEGTQGPSEADVQAVLDRLNELSSI